MKKFRLLVLVFCVITPFAHAELTAEQRTRDAQQLIDLFTHRYGPMPWKKEYLKIDFPKMSQTLLQRAASVTNDLDLYEAMIDFVASFQDKHVALQLPSTYKAYLGFNISAFGTDYLITAIDRDILSSREFPFAAGDRVITFDGLPVDQAALALAHYDESGSLQRNRNRGAEFLTRRKQARIPHLPTGSATITIQRQSSTEQWRVAIPWQHSGQPLAEFTEFSASKALAAVVTPPAPPVSIYQAAPLFAKWPEFVERNHTPILTGVVVLKELKIGYIRFHTWENDGEHTKKDVLQLLEAEIPYLNDNTDALIIDQPNNPGGKICFGQAVAQFFLPRPVPEIHFMVKPTRTWISEQESEISPDDPDHKLWSSWVEKIRAAAAAGQQLTAPIPLCNADGMLQPHTVRYTKPIVLLIDGNACSTGDMFPAVMQDAGAATLFGERTLGCGGSVEIVSYLGYSDITARVTLSLAVRSKAVVSDRGVKTRIIENVGVMPDVPYQVTGTDYLDGGKKYRAAVESTIRQLVNTQK